jgi:mono/diheme cytochrome c family protein
LSINKKIKKRAIMNKKNKTLAMLITLLLSATFISATFIFQEASEPWEVPAKFKKMENPNTADDESLKMGKMQYSKNCASCHGKTGLGDGTKARSLETFPGDFSSDAFASQTDGEHFYKSKYGRNEMPKFENKISDEDIWDIVNYIKTFKK